MHCYISSSNINFLRFHSLKYHGVCYNSNFWIWGVYIFVGPIFAEKPKFVGFMQNLTVDEGTANVTFKCTLTNIGGHKVC